MKKTSIATISWSLALFILCFLTVTNCSGKNDSSMQENAPTDTTSYSVPADKTQQWESLKNVAQKDYDVCLEHCGSGQSCLDRCETAYKNRLDNQYKMLLNKKGSGSKN